MLLNTHKNYFITLWGGCNKVFNEEYPYFHILELSSFMLSIKVKREGFIEDQSCC